MVYWARVVSDTFLTKFCYNDLDGLGFKGFADKVYTQVIGTSAILESFTSAVNECLHIFVTVGKCTSFHWGT